VRVAIAQALVPTERLAEFAHFEGLVQLISVDGQRTVGCPYWDLVVDVDAAQLRGLYRDMAIVRRLDAEAMALQRQGELALWAPLLGQEAAQVGSARALRPDDFVFPSYREHGVAFCRGVDPVDMLRMWRGSALSGWDPADYGIATPAIIVGAQALHATGYALGIVLDGRASAVVAYFGDGASSEGDVAEALGFAASYGVPVVFLCQNNQWAISEPVQLQSHATIAQRGQGYGIPGIRVDGNDVLAVLAATRLALARAYAGQGPTLIEAVTYRMGPHTTSDDPTKYRSRTEEELWRAKDPLARLRALLRTEGVADDRFEDGVDAAAAEAAAALREGVHALRDPEPTEMFEHVYADPHALLDGERAAYEGYLAELDDTADAADTPETADPAGAADPADPS
jgi:pyruvate dehydrogenase E1 component alpha subunit